MTEKSPETSADAPKPPPLRSVHTPGFAGFLQQFGFSLAVTTYQAGKLVLLRPEPAPGGGAVLNTHFRGFNKPMGLAWEPGRFALGTNAELWEFHDMPAVAKKLEPTAYGAQQDAAYLPRTVHFTGDMQIHEMAWVGKPGAVSELWFVNTRFSCLATRSGIFSFVPGWKPPFITGLAPEDRCHLNGLAARDGNVRYVTALGATDSAGGWRSGKRDGGMVMDCSSDEILVRGLSMPHSPRWHDGKLWVLESGNGGVGFVDPASGKYQEICRLPGFTRGLDFVAGYGLVGLSQVRESATFSGIAIAEMKQEDRCCGVWAVDLASGKIAGFVKFTDALQEIFAVQAMPHRCPEVVSEDPKRIAGSYELPDEALKLVP